MKNLVLVLAFLFGMCMIVRAAPTTPLPTVSPPAVGAPNDSSALIQQFLKARAPGKYSALTAFITQRSLVMVKFSSDTERKTAIHDLFGDSPAPGMPVLKPEMKAFYALLIDVDNTLGYKFTIIGPSAVDPHTVLVRADRASPLASDPVYCSIVTMPDPKSANALRIDVFASMKLMQPDLFHAHGGNSPLEAALRALTPGAFERQSVLLVVQSALYNNAPAAATEANSATAAASSALANDLSTPDGVAAAFHRLYTSYGRVLIMANPTMTVLNTDPSVAQIPLAELAGQRPLPFLLGLLTDSQLQIMATRGLSMADLTPDEQSLLRAALPDPFDIVPVSAKEPSLSKEDEQAVQQGRGPEYDAVRARLDEAEKLYASQTQTLAIKDVLASVRMRAFLATDTTFDNPHGSDFGFDPDADGPGTTGTFRLAHPSSVLDFDSTYAKHLASHLRTDVPNELKDGDLSWNRPELLRPVSLTGVDTVDTLVARIAKTTGLELHTDARYANQSVLLLGDLSQPQPARDILRALCLSLAAAWRALGPAFVLTNDVQGLGTRQAILKEAVQTWSNRLTEADRQIGGHLRDLHWASALTYGAGDPGALTTAQIAELSRQDHGKGYYETLPWSNLSPALQSALRAQMNRTTYDDSSQRAITAISQLITPTYKVGLDINLRFALEMPSTGAMTLGEVYRVQSPEVPKSSAPPKPPTQTIVLTEPLRGLLCAPVTAGEAKFAVDRLAALGMNALFCDVFHNGSTYFPNSALPPISPEAGNVLAAALSEGTLKHVAVYAVLDTLCWRKNGAAAHPAMWPVGYEPDLTIRGELPDAAIQRRLAAKSLRSDFEADAILAEQGSQEWASPQDVKVQALLPALVQDVAKTPGLAGLVFEDTVPPGYFGVDADNDMDIDLGYTPGARLAFLRTHQIDPIDMAPNYGLTLFLPFSGYETQFDVEMPDFSSRSDNGWLTVRGQVNQALMARCFQAARLASPTVPLWMRERRIGATLDPWTSPQKLNQYPSTNSLDNPFDQVGPKSVLCVSYGPFDRARTNGLARSAKYYREDIGGKRAGGILFDLVNDAPDESLPNMLDEIAPYFSGPRSTPAVSPAR